MGLLRLRIEYESSWFDQIETAQNHICDTVALPEHENASKIIVTRTLDLMSLPISYEWKTFDTFNTTAFNESDIFMSRMHYNRTCYDSKTETFNLAPGRGIQLIEPLWGMLRDPFDHWCQHKSLHMPGQAKADGQSKAHIMPQGYAPYTYTLSDSEPLKVESQEQWRSHGLPPWHSSLRPSSDPRIGTTFTPPHNIHLDLGSSYFNIWGDDKGAASGQWFYNTYHARGQPFDRFIAVEVETLNDTKAFRQIPDDLVGVYTLMNVGLTMDKGDKLNTVDMIKRVVKPEDFFVFKLDIDSAPIEEPILENLLADNPDEGGASGLIDELMFEHHVNYAPMNAPWENPQGVGDLHRSYNVFRDLRRKGIRAHSWP
ncbi:MAG: hypothetical protein L6R40_002009 [Gallowayella cf. fulva]|nr:MAG: hypothetical protein L6R40_002009 [Xanthomendoza cf. fulva]